MSYVGGKHRIRKELGALIVRECQHLRVRSVWEPFCGGLHVTAELGRRGYSVHASDLSAPALTLYKAILLGWMPPLGGVTKPQWIALKQAHIAGKAHPLISFAGFCASFNSVYFASFAEDRQLGQFEAFKKRVRQAAFATLKWCSYDEVRPPQRSVIYCDPPYAATDLAAYRSLPPDQRLFDSEAFWSWCRARRDEGSTVLVSEYVAPQDAQLLWQRDVSVHAALHTGESERALERVFIYRGSP